MTAKDEVKAVVEDPATKDEEKVAKLAEIKKRYGAAEFTQAVKDGVSHEQAVKLVEVLKLRKVQI